VYRARRQRGISAIELSFVIVIIVTILAVLLPTFMRARESARRTACRNSLRQIGTALHLYENKYGSFPAAYIATPCSDGLRTDPGWGWQSLTLADVDNEAIFNALNFSGKFSDSILVGDPFTTSRIVQLGIYTCASDRESGFYTMRAEDGNPIAVVCASSYACNYGSGGDIAHDPGGGNGFFVRNTSFAAESFPDGLRMTIAIGERGSLHTKTPFGCHRRWSLYNDSRRALEEPQDRTRGRAGLSPCRGEAAQ
jgi:type II secretory pathway pseudopilin PulG